MLLYTTEIILGDSELVEFIRLIVYVVVAPLTIAIICTETISLICKCMELQTSIDPLASEQGALNASYTSLKYPSLNCMARNCTLVILTQQGR